MPKSRYTWDPYIPRMHELYMAWTLIPMIWAAIQDDAARFTPSPRAVYYKFKSMNYPTDQHQRGVFIHKHNASRWPIDGDTNPTSTNPRTPAISPTMSANNASRNISHGSSETVLGNESVPIQLHRNNFVHTNSTFMHTGMNITQEHSKILAASNSSSTAGNPYPQDVTWPEPEDNDYQRQYGNQIPVDGINPFMFDFLQTPEPCTTPEASRRVLQTESSFDKSHVQRDAQSPANCVPLVQHSHEQSTSVIFHEQWDYWERNSWCYSVPTPGTRYPFTVAPGESFQAPSQNPTTTQKPHRHFGQHLTPSVNDSGYGGSRPSTVSEGSKIDVDFHPSSLAEIGGLLYLHEPQLAHDERSQLQEQSKGLQTCNRCFCFGLCTLSCSARHPQPDVFSDRT